MGHWDDLAPYESQRIAALPFEEMVWALCDHAPKASAGDILELLGNTCTKREIRDARDRWKANKRAAGEAAYVPQVPTRELITNEMRKALATGNSREVDRWARSLVALARAGNVDHETESTEEWDRLDDREAGVLVALTRKLNGERLTHADEAWLARLR